MPMPRIFTDIDSAMKRGLANSGWHTYRGQERRFVVEDAGRWIKSAPIPIVGTDLGIVLRGPYDFLVRFEDGTRAIIDAKTAPRAHIAERYSPQLHAYAYGLEHPAAGVARDIGQLAILAFEPSVFESTPPLEASFRGSMAWIDVPRKDAVFLEFLTGVGRVLAAPQPPSPNEDCAYCAYRSAA
jgi:hypothetical protein